MKEQRKFSRVLFETPAQLSTPDEVWDTQLLDLCLNGAMVRFPDHIEVPALLVLSFCLPGTDIEMSMQAQPVYHKNNHLGLKCAMIDVDSITHLRRLLELNTGDSSQLHRELDQFIMQHDQNA
ncbi:PilZ domain-containing protein [Shewanella sp. YIC-542]|uniref:PilZ domain-containing protein n=1 Tax=Shewanella mytili TaxID=3377111 RepID=UPI00398E65A7